MSWWNKISEFFGYETVRARDKKGRFVKDDPKTAKNEAYTKRKKRKPASKKAK